ncbi:MAG TPA: phage holin family protein [Usitatibacteraceae bacterium]|nr:phage holin family protein [Usitatibacteraceae bacterium]
MSAAPIPAAAPPGNMHSLGRSLLSLFCDRIEMVAIEFREEHLRAQRKLTLAVLAVVFLALGVQLAALVIILLFWDTYRIAAAVVTTALVLGIGAWAVAEFRHLVRNSPSAFAASMDEFRNDVQLFSGDND